jgi:hypothetical protein
MFPAMVIPVESKQQWDAWVAANVRKPFRKHARKAVQKAMRNGSSADQIVAAAKQAEESRASYMALSALALGALSAAVALFFGGVSIFATLFAVASFFQGRHSQRDAWAAWTGLALAGLGFILFSVSLAIRLLRP